MENYVNILRQHNLKATPQRAEITALLDRHGHLSIEELYELLKKKFHSLSLATIYKNINIMMENSFITEVKIPQQKSVYELSKEAHAHIVCQECNAIEDIHLNLEGVLTQASQKTTFHIDSAHLVLKGVCSTCRSAL